MTDQVLMPGADYLAICNAVRALTGGTAELKSGDIAGALAGVKRIDKLTGTWTPTEDTATCDISFRKGANLIYIKAPSSMTLEKRFFNVFFYDMPDERALNCACSVMNNGKTRGGALKASNASGFSFVSPASLFLFAGGITYTWTAYYWEV